MESESRAATEIEHEIEQRVGDTVLLLWTTRLHYEKPWITGETV